MRPKIRLSSIIILMIITAVVSGITSGVIVYTSYSKNAGISYKTINNDDALKQFLEVYSSITNEYYEDIDKTKMIEEAISGMLKYLGDNYTTYLDKDQTNMLNDTLAGEYQGIGIIIEGRKINEVLDNSPAKKAGLQIGDVITKVNDEDVTELDATDIANKIKKSTKKNVSITIDRDGEEKTIVMEISTLYVPAISKKMIDNTSIGYLSLSTFSSSVDKQVSEALEYFDKNNAKSLIIDLRGNTGGFLSAAENVASLFLKKDKIIYSLKSKNDTKVVKDKTKESTDYKIIVLINGNTASASEILAAALKDSYGATLVGEKSYGKGKVQQTVNLKDGSMAKYTSAKWLTPKGDCIDTVGLKPDYEVELTIEKDSDGNITNIIDSQLNKAIEILNN